jgi:hypothetical protein
MCDGSADAPARSPIARQPPRSTRPSRASTRPERNPLLMRKVASFDARPRPAARTTEYARSMLYRILRGINEIYGVTVLFLFIGAFFVAFAFTVIYPLVPIVLLISSIFFVVGFRLVFLALRGAERSVARSALANGACPACRTRCDAIRIGERRVQECPGCRRVFAENGDPYIPQEAPEDAGTEARFERDESAVLQ